MVKNEVRGGDGITQNSSEIQAKKATKHWLLKTIAHINKYY